jgi:hypothetical protein
MPVCRREFTVQAGIEQREKARSGSIMANQSEKLEQEAGRTRAQLSEVLKELRARMTPGQVIDQLIDYTREGPGAGLGRNLAREIRENPLPLVLIGIGIAWLMVASSRDPSHALIANARVR